jgi:peptidoglycan hydrolase CwlO-like protein
LQQQAEAAKAELTQVQAKLAETQAQIAELQQPRRRR